MCSEEDAHEGGGYFSRALKNKDPAKILELLPFSIGQNM